MRNKGHIISIVLGFILIVAGCSKAPKGILSEKEMQKVHADMLLADAIIGMNYNTYSNDTAKIALYESVFRKHKIKQAVYDSSLVWYGKNIDIYMKVYDRMLVDLNKRIHDLGDVQADAAPSSNRDSVNIWPRRDYLVLYPKSIFNGVTFDIKPDRNYSSGSSFVLGIRVWGLQKDMKHYPEIHLNIVQRDTTLRAERTITEDGYYETVIKALPTRQINRVFGYIRMDNSNPTYHKVYLDSLNLMRYNYRTEFEAPVQEVQESE